MNKIKIVIGLVALIYFSVLIGFGLNNAKANYSTDGSASASSELTVVVLPAIEQVLLSDQSWQTPTKLNRQINLGVRANFNNWSLDYYAIPTDGRSNPASCNTFGTIGNRNLDSSFQEIGLSCSQKISYGDSSNWPAIDVVYQVKSAL